MTMHKHDQEIVMALAERSLDPEAATQAAAEIAGCSDCARDLELQRIALEAIADAPAVYLTATESARLHDRLHRELGAAVPAPRRNRGTVVWGRWVGAALGTAAVFLAAFLVLPNVLGGSSDDSADTVAFEEVAEDTSDGEGNRMEMPAAAATPSVESPQLGMDDAAGADEMAEPTTTVAAAETTAAPETTQPAGDVSAFLEYRVIGGLNEELRSEIIGQLTMDREVFVAQDETLKTLNPEWAACLETLPALDVTPSEATPQIVGSVVDQDERERMLVAFITSEPAETTLASVSVPECTVFETLP